MRFKSRKTDGFQIFAVTGINTVSFGIVANSSARKGLLGFAVERADPEEQERYFLPGFKVFPSVISHPDETTRVSTFEHPVQSFVWDDFTAKSGYTYEYFFYPLRGKPRHLDRSAPPIRIEVMAEPLFSGGEHDVFFNRGVASSQAYSRRFDNKPPDELSPAKAKEALEWLSRKLDEALLKFIGQAKKNDTLLGCFYEFRYPPVAEALKEAIDRGVAVKLIVDGKKNGKPGDDGEPEPPFPRQENLKTLRDAGIARKHVTLREARTGNIQHNKFLVLLKGKSARPSEVWTGSTNMSTGGIHGQTNVGHWVRNEEVATHFQAYWEFLSTDPGGAEGDSATEVRQKNKEMREGVEGLLEVPLTVDEIPDGTTPIFSPRSGLEVLDMFVSMVDGAESSAYITLAFGVNKAFKQQLEDNTRQSHIVFLLLEKRDRPNAQSRDAFVAINSSHNVYSAWGSYLKEPLYQWTKETNARLLNFNRHVSYVHSKFLLMDPLSKDPIVVTGSANFSNNSTKENDENMLVIRGDKRVADIYLTEFNRLFNHYYFRSVVEATSERGRTSAEDTLFLKEVPDEWLSKYKPGTLRQKRVNLFAGMEGFECPGAPVPNTRHAIHTAHRCAALASMNRVDRMSIHPATTLHDCVSRLGRTLEFPRSLPILNILSIDVLVRAIGRLRSNTSRACRRCGTGRRRRRRVTRRAAPRRNRAAAPVSADPLPGGSSLAPAPSTMAGRRSLSAPTSRR